jgi:hypothetical protein
VHCEALVCEPPRLLRYSWKGGSDTDPKAALLDSSVTWTLTPAGDGTHLRMAHEGFVFPANQMAYEAMKPGWAGCSMVSSGSPRGRLNGARRRLYAFPKPQACSRDHCGRKTSPATRRGSAHHGLRAVRR